MKGRFTRTSGFVLALWIGLQASPAVPAQEASDVTGTYRDDRVVVELNRAKGAQDDHSYTGLIQLGERKFPLKVEIFDGHLTGTFEDQGDQWPLTGSVVGRMLVFTTGGTTYRLKKLTANPLAQPSRPNPLASPRTNLVRPVPVPTNHVAAPAVPARDGSLRFKRYSVMDQPGMIGGEAFSLLIPADWQVEGGVAWRVHPTTPAYVAMRVSNPEGTEVLESFPATPFVWAEGGIPFFPPGTIYMGNEVAEPIEDPATYVRQILLPRYRQFLQTPQFVGTEDLPRVAEAIGGTQQAGVQKKCRAARVRIEYPENGRTMQEDIYCVLSSVYIPANRATFWGPDRNYSFKAEKGRLDLCTKTFQTMVDSFRSNPQWFNRYLQLIQILVQTPLEGTRRASEFSRYIARTTDEVTDARRQAYARQQASQELVNASFNQYVRGLEEYRNPFENRTVELPAGYRQVWANPLGEYVLSESANLNPNFAPGEGWQRLERTR